MRDICGRYRLVRKLGEGGTGTVYQAADLVLGRAVAVKALHDTSLDLGREARSLAQLSHPGIVALYDILDDGGRSYLVMEYVEGISLERLLSERGPLGPARASEIVRQIGEVLVHAHARGILHCDLTPANVLLSTHGEVKLLDLTLARVLDGGCFSGPAGGSGPYAAPEQFGGETGPWTDIFGLGALLRRLAGPLDPGLRGDEEVLAAVTRATAHHPRDRFPSIERFLAALPSCDDITRAGPVAPLANLTRVLPENRRRASPSPSSRPLVALCAAFALLAAAVSAHFTVLASPARVTVPNLVAAPDDSARLVAASLGLRVQLTRRYAGRTAGTVLAQQPLPGSAVSKDTMMTLVVSKGPAPVQVPDLLGARQGDAVIALERLGLRVIVHIQDTISRPAGVILSQQPASLTNVKAGAIVTLTASTKPWWWIF